MEWALDAGTTENGAFGAKLMWGYLVDTRRCSEIRLGTQFDLVPATVAS